ncbi:disease resistance protein rga4-like, partial [Trifolium pratense]
GLNLNPKVGVVEKTNNEWRETGSYVPESNIIGREDDKEKIVSLLREPHGDPNVSFVAVAIVGMGGLGKTTLAQLNMLKSILPKEKIDDTLTLDNLQSMLRDNLTVKL